MQEIDQVDTRHSFSLLLEVLEDGVDVVESLIDFLPHLGSG